MDDITALILDDHAAFRRGFARLDDARDPAELLAVWEALALHLDIHAETGRSGQRWSWTYRSGSLSRNGRSRPFLCSP
jgi:hypothetical protein